MNGKAIAALIGAALCATIPAAAQSPIADPKASFDEVQGAWRSWFQATRELPLSTSHMTVRSANQPPSVTIRRFARRNDYYYSNIAFTENGVEKEVTVIANEHYAAVLGRLGSGEWRLQRLARRGTREFKQLEDYLHADCAIHTMWPHPVFRELVASKKYVIAEATREVRDGQTVRRFVFVPTGTLRKSVRAITIEVSEKRGLLPVSFRYEAVSAGASFERFEEWENSHGVWKWRKSTLTNPHETGNRIENTWEILSPESPLRTEQCYLKAYGIPEPEFAKSRRRVWWLVAGATLVIISIVAMLKLRS